MRALAWHAVPAKPLKDTLSEITWRQAAPGARGGEISALMVFVALLFSREPLGNVAVASYDDLMEHTGRSRSLVRRGISRLEELGLIVSQGSVQKRYYLIAQDDENEDSHWYFKLPCRAILSADHRRIEPFHSFTLRSKHELNALKLHLYFALVRPRNEIYSMASYETIREKTGISERDIRSALNVLNASGILQGVDREHSAGKKENEPNKYYLRGYRDLFSGLRGRPDVNLDNKLLEAFAE